MKSRFLMAVILLIQLFCSTSEAGIVLQHQGSNDPLTEGFSFNPYNGTGVTKALANDQGVAAWSIQNVSYDLPNGYYQLDYVQPINSPSSLQNGFTLSVIARVPTGATFSSPDYLARSVVAVGVGTLRLDLELGATAQGDTEVILANNVIVNLPSRTFSTYSSLGQTSIVSGLDYHLYQLVYHSTSSSADLYIDGVLKITGYSPSLTNSYTILGNELLFGSFNQGTANFNLVRLETGTTVASVPEPGTLGIALSAIMVAIAWRLSRLI